MRLVDWAEKQGITYQTAWRWFKAGKLPVPAIKTPTGMILVQEPAAPQSYTPITCIYARVSSNNKRDDLERQAERCKAFCAANGWTVDGIVKEVASGMNDSRPKLMKLLEKRPARIVVEHKDRLTRFGFNYLDILLPKLGCEVVVMNRAEEPRDDLMKDMVSVITSFCCRLYGLRRGTSKAKRAKEAIRAKNG